MSNRSTTALAVTAVIVAVLGWTPVGESAQRLVFPRNSVGTAQLKANAVTGPKIRNGSVTGSDIKRRSITAAQVKPGSLLASSFASGQLPAGLRGEKGEKGDRGEKGDKGDKGLKGDVGSPGLSGYQLVQGAGTSLAANGTAFASVICPAGKSVVGGGGHVAGGVAGAGYLWQSMPISATTWRVGYKSSGTAATIWAWAVCANVAP